MRTRLFMMVALLCTMFLPQFLYAQNKTISGKITDVGGNPIPGVTISINNSNQGTFADALGQFTISAPENATLTISSTGYKTQTIKASEVTGALQIKMEEDVAK